MAKASPSLVKIEVPAGLHEFLQAFGSRVVKNRAGKWSLSRAKAAAAIAAVEPDAAEQKRLLKVLAAAIKDLNDLSARPRGAPVPV